MNNLRVLALLDRLRTAIAELENEIKSNPSGYLEGVTYDDILKYEDINDDDGDY